MTARDKSAATLVPGPVAALALLIVALHLATNIFTRYGVHRDEFLYLAMGRHLDLFRMEFPPAIAILARVSTLFGESMLAIRFVPALAGGFLVALASLIARELGSQRPAQFLAALCVALSPLFLRAANLFQPVVFDQLWWTLGLFALVKLCQTGKPRWWLWYGLAVGLGLLTKFSAVFFGVATFLALVASSLFQRPFSRLDDHLIHGQVMARDALRHWLVTPWPWVALLLVLLIGSPSWIGQATLGYPVMQQMADLREAQLERVTPLAFIVGQLQLGPAFLIALLGLSALLFGRALIGYRLVGWTCLFVFLILLVLKGKPYYLGPVYPTLFAAGSVAIERLASQRVARLATWVGAVLVISYGLLLLPIGIPILPPELMARYTEIIGASEANRTNRGEIDRLPQDYADMLGWPEQVAVVATVYNSLPPDERGRAVIIAGNYGEAGAIDYFGPRYGLPAAISAAGGYWFFGPGKKPGEIAVTVGLSADDLRPFFADVRQVRRFSHPWAVSEERDVPIMVASRPYRKLQQVWPSLAGNN